jgi:hypothetical protein
MRPSVALVGAGLALSGCIAVECPAEIARPVSRERYCGHTGDVAAPVTYRTYGTAVPRPMPATTTTTTTTTAPAPAPVMAPPPSPGSVTVQPMPAPSSSSPTQIR